MSRCSWCNEENERYVKYHDEEWGRLNLQDTYLYEMLILEIFQGGLSFECVLNKRENIRKAFDGFSIEKVCGYDKKKVDELSRDPGIIRNRKKIEAIIKNSLIFADIQKEYGSFHTYLRLFSEDLVIHETDRTGNELSDRLSKDLKSRGMKYVGSKTIYSFLQAVGIIDSHEKGCFLYQER